mgnify:CR=1 FL=1
MDTTTGYILFKVFEQHELPLLRKEFDDTCSNFPEFLKTDQYVLGGFSALGNPSSFHNYFVRFVRYKVFKILKNILKNQYKGKYIQCLFDRMMYRPSGQTPSKESWHRDSSQSLHENDTVFGGWVNFDDNSQYFSCVPGTYKKQDKSGFMPIKDEDFTGTKVEIKPGHGILFHQTLIHEVLPTKLKYNSYRVFHGIRISDIKDTPFDYTDIIEDQGVPPEPSGQIPPMYAKLHLVNHLEKLINFSKFLIPICHEEYTRKTTGEKYIIVKRYLKSLREYNLPMYNVYQEKEKDIFLPFKLE